MNLENMLISSLERVKNSDQFEDWVKNELRRHLPHAAILVTVGKLYGVGSVPTHRLSVDFPLSLVERLKNSAGALDDPLMFGWFKSEKFRYVDLQDLGESGQHRRWQLILNSYGIRSMMIHGLLQHSHKRFMVVQICNPTGGGSIENVQLLSSLVQPLARVVFNVVDEFGVGDYRTHVGHPTISLTATELHIIELLAQGLSNKEIARRRGVSDSTVKTQVQRTGAKIGATRRAEIVAIAMPMLSPLPSQGLLDYGDDNMR